MIKILHCGDIHLDSPFQLQDAEKSDIRRNELRGTFSSLTLYAKSNNIDLMLIAGDLFDSEYVTKETVALVCREFASIPECRIVISPGNHDPYTENSVYARTAFPDNVYLFDSSSLSYFSFDDIGVDVYGYAFTSPTMTENPFAGHTPKKSDRINILCAHGDTRTPISNFCPITASDIKNSGFDYIALGHYHDSDGVEKAGDTYYAYSRCLEGRDFGETGHKGAISAEMSKDGGVFSITSKGLRFSKRRYEAETLDVSGACDDKTVQSKIKALLAEYGLKAVSAHVQLAEMIEDMDKVIATYKEIGCKYIAIP